MRQNFWKLHNLAERQRLDKIKKDFAINNNINFLEITYKDNIVEKLEKYFNNGNCKR